MFKDNKKEYTVLKNNNQTNKSLNITVICFTFSVYTLKIGFYLYSELLNDKSQSIFTNELLSQIIPFRKR